MQNKILPINSIQNAIKEVEIIFRIHPHLIILISTAWNTRIHKEFLPKNISTFLTKF